jgi:hypothetical protein
VTFKGLHDIISQEIELFDGWFAMVDFMTLSIWTMHFRVTGIDETGMI